MSENEEVNPIQQVVADAVHQTGVESTVSDSLKEEIPQNQFTTLDENMMELVDKDPDLKPLAPLYSHLLRLTNITPKEKMEFQNKIDLIIGSILIGMSRRDFNNGKWAKLESHAMYLKQVPCDSVKGFKMELLSRIRHEHAFEQPMKQKKGLFRL